MTPQMEFATVQTNGVNLRVALAGTGPLVVLVHGFPESWYSWRHQIPALAAAGYRVAAPDVRGYGGSDKPPAVEAYAIKEMCADIAGLIEALGERQAILIGHDWGAPIVWNTSLFFPQKVRAVAGVERASYGKRPGPPHRAVSEHLQGPLLLSALFPAARCRGGRIRDRCARSLGKSTIRFRAKAGRRRPDRQAGRRESRRSGGPEPAAGLAQPDDLEYYAGEFARSGFRGPLNRYRTSELDFAQQAETANRRIEQPAAFIAGSLEPVLTSSRGSTWSRDARAGNRICGSFELSTAPAIGCSRSVPPKSTRRCWNF